VRRAFNDLWSFVAGWALVLNYVVTVAISAVTAAYYLSYFWAPLKAVPWIGALGGMVVVLLLMLLNIRGVKEASRVNIGFAVIDLITQGLLVVLGISLVIAGWHRLTHYHTMGPAFWPNGKQLFYAVAIAMVAYIGLESAAQMAEETKTPAKTVPRALFLSVATVIFMYACLPIVALSAMDPSELVREWGQDPVAGIASKLPDLRLAGGAFQGKVSLAMLMQPWVALLASTILLIAANAGILAGSRISFNMAHHKQLFPSFTTVHPRYNTPCVAIGAVSLAAIGIIALGMKAPRLLLLLGDLYVFGAMMAFSLAHLSVGLLRVKEPDLPRPFRAWGNIRIKGRSISVTATVGFLSTFGIWLTILFSGEHWFGRTVGLGWIAVGLIFYVWLRRRQGLSLSEPSVKEEPSRLVAEDLAPKRREMIERIDHILIPVHNERYADEMTRIACDLASLYVAEVTAIHVVEVPRALPVDAELPEQTKAAEAVLERAYHIADTVYDRKVSTVVLQARSAAVGIVEYAAEQGMDLILLSVPPERTATMGERVFGTTVDHVVRHAPCPVWTLRGGQLAPEESPPGDPEAGPAAE